MSVGLLLTVALMNGRFMLLIGFVCFVAAALASQPATKEDKANAKITSSVELVLIPAIVTDKSGKPVRNLSKNDFTLFENNRPQTISVFEEVQEARDSRRAQPATVPGKQEFTNTYGASTVGLTVIAIDLINTPAQVQINLRDELIKFLDGAAQRPQAIAIVTLTSAGVHVLHDFTTDRQVLVLALAKLHNTVSSREPAAPTPIDEDIRQLAMTENLSVELALQLDNLGRMKDAVERNRRFRTRAARQDTLGALAELAHYLGGVPGRKTVVWASAGFPFGDNIFVNRGGTRVAMNLENLGSALDEEARVWHLLAAANIAIYPVDARGIVNAAFSTISPEFKTSPLYSDKDVAQREFQANISTFESLAQATGGVPCYNRSDLHNCFRDAMDDGQHYYMLGYYLPKGQPGWRALKVQVQAKHVAVRTRTGVLVAPPASSQASDSQQDVRRALAAPFAFSSLPLRGAWLSTDERGAVRFELTIAPESLAHTLSQQELDLSIIAVAKDREGKAAATISQKVTRHLDASSSDTIREAGIRYTNRFALQSGQYQVTFVVRDNISGNVGSVRAALDLP